MLSMKNIITVQHTQSVHHTNGMVGSWTDDSENIIIVSHGDLLSVFNTMFLGLNVETINSGEIFGQAGGVS